MPSLASPQGYPGYIGDVILYLFFSSVDSRNTHNSTMCYLTIDILAEGSGLEQNLKVYLR